MPDARCKIRELCITLLNNNYYAKLSVIIQEAQRGKGSEAQRKMKTYRDLQVWKKSMTLVAEIHNISKVFPKNEAYGLPFQMRRCAISIPSNMATDNFVPLCLCPY